MQAHKISQSLVIHYANQYPLLIYGQERVALAVNFGENNLKRVASQHRFVAPAGQFTYGLQVGRLPFNCLGQRIFRQNPYQVLPFVKNQEAILYSMLIVR